MLEPVWTRTVVQDAEGLLVLLRPDRGNCPLLGLQAITAPSMRCCVGRKKAGCLLVGWHTVTCSDCLASIVTHAGLVSQMSLGGNNQYTSPSSNEKM